MGAGVKVRQVREKCLQRFSDAVHLKVSFTTKLIIILSIPSSHSFLTLVTVSGLTGFIAARSNSTLGRVYNCVLGLNAGGSPPKTSALSTTFLINPD